MGFLDKARKAIGEAAAAVSRETEGLSLHAQLGNLDTELERQLLEVGKRARELHQAGKFQDEQIGTLLKRVVEIEEKMAELRQQVAANQSAGAPAATPPPEPPPPSVPPPSSSG